MAERALRKAQFCLATGIAPSEYEQLNGYEIEALIRVVNERSR